MNSLLERHFEKILRGDASATEDYSKNLICIARVGGKPETLDSSGTKTLLIRLQKAISFPDAHMLVKRTTEEYGVLAVQSPFAPFLSYTCIVKHRKIAYTTLYLYRPLRNLMPHITRMPKSKNASKIFGKHFRAMFSMKAKVIVKDYAENGVVMTNMAKATCDGKEQIYDFCNHLMHKSWALMKKLNFHGITSVRWSTKSAGDGLLLFTCEAPAMKMIMTETYWVEGGKIQFECSIAHGPMLNLIHKILY